MDFNITWKMAPGSFLIGKPEPVLKKKKSQGAPTATVQTVAWTAL